LPRILPAAMSVHLSSLECGRHINNLAWAQAHESWDWSLAMPYSVSCAGVSDALAAAAVTILIACEWWNDNTFIHALAIKRPAKFVVWSKSLGTCTSSPAATVVPTVKRTDAIREGAVFIKVATILSPDGHWQEHQRHHTCRHKATPARHRSNRRLWRVGTWNQGP
jgi:hypothetical protein